MGTCFDPQPCVDQYFPKWLKMKELGLRGFWSGFLSQMTEGNLIMWGLINVPPNG